MRKLKLQMQMSVDGFVSTGPNDEQKWVTWALEDIYQHVLDLLNSIDTILIGRKLAVDYIPYWQDVVTQPDHPMHAFGQRIVGARKIIFTKTLDRSKWDNTELAHGDLAEEVRELKNGSGKDIIVYGGSSFVSSLVRAKLIDEFHLFVNPVALGKGEPVFAAMEEWMQLKLVDSIACKSGIVIQHYEPR